METALNLIFSEQIIIFDTETGGLNPENEIEWDVTRNLIPGDKIEGVMKTAYAPILEIGAIKLNQFNLEELDYFYSLCGPEEGKNIEDLLELCTPAALEVNKINNRLDELSKAPPLSLVLRNFIDWARKDTKKYIPGGQNVRFDIDMINASCRRLGIDYQIYTQPLELRDFSQFYFALPDTPIVANYKLSTIAEALGISTKNAHHALVDVRIEAECFRQIFKRLSAF